MCVRAWAPLQLLEKQILDAAVRVDALEAKLSTMATSNTELKKLIAVGRRGG